MRCSLSFSEMEQNWSSAKGRVWPGHTMGICRPVVVMGVGVGSEAGATAAIFI